MAIIRGPIAWAKINPDAPVPGYTKSLKEWTFDLGIDEAAAKTLHDLGCEDYIKPAEKNGKTHVLGMPYIKLTRRELRADGSKAKPFRVVDSRGQPWPGGKPIGNGSVVNVKVAANPKQDGSGNKPSAIAIQVWEEVEYEGGDSFPTREADGEESWASAEE